MLSALSRWIPFVGGQSEAAGAQVCPGHETYFDEPALTISRDSYDDINGHTHDDDVPSDPLPKPAHQNNENARDDDVAVASDNNQDPQQRQRKARELGSSSNNDSSALDSTITGFRRLSHNSRRFFTGTMARLTMRLRNEFVVAEDISNGRERYKVPALSYKRTDQAPFDYNYVTEHVQYEQMPVDLTLSSMKSCTCWANCGDGRCHCSSGHPSGRYYDSRGRLAASYNVDSPEVIYECNAGCRCNRKSCRNMVIQGGCKARLVLFRTRSRGWGVRTVETLKRGTFLGVYSGELIPASQSHRRPDDTYLFNLAPSHIYRYRSAQEEAPSNEPAAADPEAGSGATTVVDNSETVAAAAPAGELVGAATVDQPMATSDTESSNDVGQGEPGHARQEPMDTEEEEGERPQQVSQHEQQQLQQPLRENCPESEQFVCDAKYFGNFTRFLNHSCEPNVIGIRAFTTHHDQRFPYIAFFTRYQIAANSELTLNYGDNYWLVKCQRDNIFCLCRAASCRFNKKTFPRTLKEYNATNKQYANQ